MNHNYKELQFKCGLEIHQQLEGKKLFCNCPTVITREKSDYELQRRLKASAGEAGDVDKAAIHELKKQKQFSYQGYDVYTCEVEADESPPLEINKTALKSAIQIAKLLNCQIVDQIQVMRKIVIDGSNTSGFQRTMLIGMDGFIELESGRIRIATLCLEEEAAQVVERKKDHDVYNLSRLGIPLLEIATEADIQSPLEAKEAAQKIGMILRSIPECKRGIGSIRQDVNLSIKNGSRVEIKGFQELKGMPKVIDFEIDRQLKSVQKGEQVKSEVRKAEPDLTTSYLRPMPGGDRMYPETDLPSFQADLKNIRSVEMLSDRITSLSSVYGLSTNMSAELIRLGEEEKFSHFSRIFCNLEPMFIAKSIVESPKEIKTRFGKEPSKEFTESILSKANSGDIPKSAVFELLVETVQGKQPDSAKYKTLSEDALDEEIKKLINDNPEVSVQGLMGMAMAKYRGKIEGKKLMELLKKYKQ